MASYDFKKIEKKWQERWGQEGLARADDNLEKPKKYILDMFPYPSGAGLHIGHVESYTATDIYSRFLRMRGFNVLHPQGWDAFGLPAENYAIKTGIHPVETTKKAIATFKRQIKSMGFLYDWEREINSSEPEYYKWTQWFFLLLYKHGLAYKKKAKVNWCEKCQTVLANEQAEGGKCERCESPVIQKDLEQWFFKITDFIEDQEYEGRKIKGLLTGLDDVDWPESTKQAQKNWIGRSEGAIVKFKVKSEKLKVDEELEVFTTRPDTLFGCTYMVVCPEHKLLQNRESEIKNQKEIKDYIEQTKKKSNLERTDLAKDKTGVKIEGLVAVNPVNGEEIPIFAADYVLPDYGTGAIMAVPAHDERDWEFAQKYNIPIKPVVLKQEKLSHSFLMGANNISDKDLEKLDIQIVTKDKNGNLKILIPFQNIEKYKELIRKKMLNHYWNEFSTQNGFYFIFKHKDGKIEEFELNEKTNNVIDKYGMTFNDEKPKKKAENVYTWLAENDFYKDLLIHTSEGIAINSDFLNDLPTAEAKEKMIEWLEENGVGERAVNYKLRDWLVSRQRYWGAPIPIIYCDKCGEVPVPEEDLPVRLPDDVDFKPTGESPLKYSQKFHNVKCPKCGAPARRESDTMDTFVCSSWYYLRYADPRNEKEFASREKIKKWLPVDLYIGGAEHTVLHLLYSRFFTKVLQKYGYLDFNEPFIKLRHQGIILAEDGNKMSKSKGNVINPDEVVAQYGADTLRMYEMFMGPLEDTKPWNTKGIMGIKRFLERVWKLQFKIQNSKFKVNERLLHKTIKKVTEDIEALKFNTAISAMMILVNQLEKEKEITKDMWQKFLLILSPFAPHLVEELWAGLGHKESIFKQKWPPYDEKLIKDETINLVIQVNGKVRDMVAVTAGISDEEIKKIALGREKIKKWISGKKITKVIFVKGKLVNIVVK